MPAEDNTIRLALIGCGGRGSGAAANALTVPNGHAKLVAMADLFEDRITGLAARRSPGSSERRSTCPPTGNSWASTPTARRSTACVRATWPC